MPDIKGVHKLTENDQAKVRMLKAKVSLAEAGFNVRRYREIQKAIIRNFPQLDTIESGKKLRDAFNLHNSNLEYIGYFEQLAELEKAGSVA